METFETRYRIKHFKNAKDKGFLKAMRIYSNYFDPKSMTDTNEISLWLDRNYTAFNDKFYCLGLILNEEVVGYAQFAYFNEEKIVFIDYIVIDEKYRRNDTFYLFVYKIKDFILHECLSFNYIVAEIVSDSKVYKPSDSSILLIRLLKLCGFGVIKAAYYQPKLGVYNLESDTNALMMIRTNSEVTDLEYLKRETFLEIIKTIYFKHYRRWYSIYEETISEYESHLNQKMKSIELDVKKKDIIYINGYKHLLEPEKNVDFNYKRPNNIFQTIILSILFISILTISLLLFIKEYDIKPILAITIYLLILISFFGFLGIFYKQANTIFDKFVALFKHVFGKLK